jgi:hypothetical protein
MHFCAKAAKEEQRNGAVQKLIIDEKKGSGPLSADYSLAGVRTMINISVSCAELDC